jgi:hypothetical protein
MTSSPDDDLTAGRIDLIQVLNARQDLMEWRAKNLDKPLTIELRAQLETEYRAGSHYCQRPHRQNAFSSLSA